MPSPQKSQLAILSFKLKAAYWDERRTDQDQITLARCSAEAVVCHPRSRPDRACTPYGALPSSQWSANPNSCRGHAQEQPGLKVRQNQSRRNPQLEEETLLKKSLTLAGRLLDGDQAGSSTHSLVKSVPQHGNASKMDRASFKRTDERRTAAHLSMQAQRTAESPTMP